MLNNMPETETFDCPGYIKQTAYNFAKGKIDGQADNRTLIFSSALHLGPICALADKGMEEKGIASWEADMIVALGAGFNDGIALRTDDLAMGDVHDMFAALMGREAEKGIAAKVEGTLKHVRAAALKIARHASNADLMSPSVELTDADRWRALLARFAHVSITHMRTALFTGNAVLTVVGEGKKAKAKAKAKAKGEGEGEGETTRDPQDARSTPSGVAATIAGLSGMTDADLASLMTACTVEMVRRRDAADLAANTIDGVLRLPAPTAQHAEHKPRGKRTRKAA